MSVAKDGKSISLAPVEGNNVTGVVDKNGITYVNLFSGADAHYYVKGSSVKEDLVLKSYNNQNVFSYEIRMNGVKASTDSAGTIIFSDNNGKKLWYFQDSYMTDANGKYSDKVTLTLRKANGKTYVDVTADSAFLQDPGTKYPVTIDPTIDTWNVIRDTFISASYPNTSYSSDSYFHTGQTPSFGTTRSLVQFALSSLPSGSKITSADFNAYQTKVDATNVSIDLYRATSAWTGAGTTWNNQPAISSTMESTTTSNAPMRTGSGTSHSLQRIGITASSPTMASC